TSVEKFKIRIIYDKITNDAPDTTLYLYSADHAIFENLPAAVHTGENFNFDLRVVGPNNESNRVYPYNDVVTFYNDLPVNHPFSYGGSFYFIPGSIFTSNVKHVSNVYFLTNRSNMMTATLGWISSGKTSTNFIASTNEDPLVSITYPPDTAELFAGNPLIISADASDAFGSISNVEFYTNDALLGNDTNSPFSYEIASTTNGSYTLKTRAYDYHGGSAWSLPVNITINAPTPSNQAPVASAGTNLNINYPASANLNGSVSDDGIPVSLPSASWLVISGPGIVSIADTNATNTTAGFSELGTYILRLTATDGELIRYDEISITVLPSIVLGTELRFDDAGGTNASDSSGNNNHGSLFGGPAWVSGISAGALSFDGSNDYVSLAPVNNPELSFSAWFYKYSNDTVNADALFRGWRYNADVQLQEGFEFRFYTTSPNKLDFILVTENGIGTNTNRTISYTFPNSVSNWYFVTGTYNAATGSQKLYIDGSEKTSTTHPAGNTVVPLTFYTDMRVGYGANNGYFAGKLDELRLYNYALSSAEISNLYKNVDSPPQITVTSPGRQWITNAGFIFSGTASNSSGALTGVYFSSNGTSYGPVNGTLSWTTNINLAGLENKTNIFYIIASNDRGKAATNILTNFLDFTPPEISFDIDYNNKTFSYYTNITGTVYDSFSGITLFTLLATNNLYSKLYTLADNPTNWSNSVNTMIFSNGIYDFILTAKNQAGFTSLITYTNIKISNDTGIMSLLSPTNNSLITGITNISGIIIPGTYIPAAAYMSNTETGGWAEVTLVNATNWSTNYNTSGLADGPNNFKFMFVSSNNVSNSSLSAGFTVDNTKPFITLFSPSNNQESAASNTDINLYFSEVMPYNITNYISVTNTNGAAVGSWSLVSGTNAVFTPAGMPGNYSSKVFVNASVKDLAGIAMDATNISFTLEPMYPVVPGMAAHWRLDETNGSTAFDTSTNTNNGTLAGSAVFSNGRLENAVHFNGVTDYISVPRMNFDQITLSAWFYKYSNDTAAADAVFGGWKYNADIQQREGFDIRFLNTIPEKIDFILTSRDTNGTNSFQTAVYTFPDSRGAWHHVAATYNTNGEQKLYINGSLKDTRNHPAGNVIVPLAGYPDMRIGYSRVNNGYFSGMIDDVRVYNYPLNGSEISNLFISASMAPIISITNPAASSWITNQSVIFSGLATNAFSSVTGVYFSTNGTLYGKVSGTSNWSTNINLAGLSDRTNVFYFIVSNSEGKAATNTQANYCDFSAPVISFDLNYNNCVIQGLTNISGTIFDSFAPVTGGTLVISNALTNAMYAISANPTNWTNSLASGNFADGLYTFILSATNTAGLCAGLTQTNILFSNTVASNTPPLASFTVWSGGLETNSIISSNSVQFFFTNTTIPGSGAVTNYSWSFGDGGGTNATNASHNYTNGTYWVSLSAQDNNGLYTAASNQVSVIFPATVVFTVLPSSLNSNIFFPVYVSSSNTGSATNYLVITTNSIEAVYTVLPGAATNIMLGLAQNLSNTLAVYASNSLVFVSATNSNIYVIDTITPSGLSNNYAYTNGCTYTNAYSLGYEFFTEDNLTGAACYVSVNSAGFVMTNLLSLSADGWYTNSFYAVDAVGNTSVTDTHYILIDTAAPVLTGYSPLSNAVLADTNILFSWTYADSGSGILSYDLFIDTNTAIAGYEFTNAGISSNSFYYSGGFAFLTNTNYWCIGSKDKAGNTSFLTTNAFLIDVIPPWHVSLASPEP
ncbi:MAG TPA: hypothetical protein DC049_15545, partial [Spirochaetia bacterium]|nr:hypothetical protein [Spirochaetia bacterium]